MRTHISRLYPALVVLVLLGLCAVPAAQGQKLPLASPDRLEVLQLNSEEVLLTWRDRSAQENSFEVQRRGPDTIGWETVAEPPINRTNAIIPVGVENPSTFRVRAVLAQVGAVSDWSGLVSFTPLDPLNAGPCVSGGRDLCLMNNRFRVRVDWRIPETDAFGRGVARRFRISNESGTFWFFDPDNIELVVKVLDGRPVNNFFWVFHGGLSHIEYWVTVVDTVADTTRTFHKFPGTLCGGGSTDAFPIGGLPPSPPIPPEQTAPDPFAASVLSVGGTGFACVPSDTAACLNDGRFQVSVEWADPRSGNSGPGMALVGTNDSGFFYFFDERNVELVTKIIDGTSVNGKFWFFYGGLTDVEYTIQVTDVMTGRTRMYHNPAFNICGAADLSAF
jgi:hypothetical protein